MKIARLAWVERISGTGRDRAPLSRGARDALCQGLQAGASSSPAVRIPRFGSCCWDPAVGILLLGSCCSQPAVRIPRFGSRCSDPAGFTCEAKVPEARPGWWIPEVHKCIYAACIPLHQPKLRSRGPDPVPIEEQHIHAAVQHIVDAPHLDKLDSTPAKAPFSPGRKRTHVTIDGRMIA